MISGDGRSPLERNAAGNRVMKTQYYIATSLDGFIATEDDSLDWLFSLGAPSDSGYSKLIAAIF